MAEEKKEIWIVVNVVDADGDGKIDMVSFLNERGSVGLAIDKQGRGKVDKIYVFQDVTGDGRLDTDDEKRLEELANQMLKNADQLPPGPQILKV